METLLVAQYKDPGFLTKIAWQLIVFAVPT
jgi:hypothetical protein